MNCCVIFSTTATLYTPYNYILQVTHIFFFIIEYIYLTLF